MSSYKYSTSTRSTRLSRTERWRGLENNPWMTDHALERWDQRMPLDACSPEAAYRESSLAVALERHPVFRTQNGNRPTEVRVCRRWVGEGDDEEAFCPVFIIVKESIVTVNRVTRINNSAVRAHLYAVADAGRDL